MVIQKNFLSLKLGVVMLAESFINHGETNA